MATTGWIFPTTFDQAALAFGSIHWTDRANVGADDAAYATVSTLLAEEYSHGIDAKGFNMSAITDGSTINSISVRFERQAVYPGVGQVSDYIVQLLKAGSPSGSDLANTVEGAWQTTLSVVDYGGTLWGTTWTAAEVKSGTFGVRFAAVMYSDEVDPTEAKVDYVAINVDYTAPAGVFHPQRRANQAVHRASSW